MTDFSQITDLQTSKDHLIAQMVSSTGLSVERIEKLYESFSYANQGDLVKINESFSSFIDPSSTFFNFENFKNQLIDLSQQLINPTISAEERLKITDEMYKAVMDNCGFNIGSTELLEVICYILLLKNDKFEKISNSIGFGKATQNLFESAKINFTPLNVSKENSKEINNLNAGNDKKLYESLKNILARNNKRWGYNYHLDNVYNTIVTYLDEEITEIVNMDNVYAVNDTFHMELIKQLLTEKQIDQSFRYIDVLRKLVPDIQTLVFDFMLLIHSYTVDKKDLMEFIARNTLIDFQNAEKTLFSAISSSLKASKISKLKSIDPENFLNNFELDSSKFDFQLNKIHMHAINDMLHMIKSSETEFNLNLRKVINNYVTKSFNLFATTEKIIIRQNNVK